MEIKRTYQQDYAEILERYLNSSGDVDYIALMADDRIIRYAKTLEGFDLANLETRNEHLAFWINAYNILSIYAVIRKLRKDPGFVKRGNQSLLQKARFFVLQRFTVGGKKYSLRAIENNIRKEFNEPRIHFALNCSSKSCPPLKDGLYAAESLDEELDSATRLFVNSPVGAVLDIDNGVLYLNEIFKWYVEDFEKTGKSVLQFVTRYLQSDKKKYVLEHQESIQIEYTKYDWNLNITKDSS